MLDKDCKLLYHMKHNQTGKKPLRLRLAALATDLPAREEALSIMDKHFIYADNAATTKLSSTALKAMLPCFEELYANPSSTHLLGQRAAAALLEARQQLAQLLHCAPRELYFTSGGSEADNQALLSAAALGRSQGKLHIISTAIEHHAILHTLEQLKQQGFSVTLLQPSADGRISVSQVAAALRPDTCLVSVMYANNETGALQPITQLGALCRQRGVLLHTDAVQAAGHVDINIERDNIDLLSLAAHKFHGPRGVGLLYARSGILLTSLIHGGGQERGKRAGTENLPGIVGMAAALNEAVTNLERDSHYISSLRDRLRAGLDALAGTQLNGSREHCLPGTANYSFSGVSGEALLSRLSNEGICLSSGSACSAGSIEPSHVLLAMGVAPKLGQSALRFSFCAQNTPEEVDIIIARITAALKALRH